MTKASRHYETHRGGGSGTNNFKFLAGDIQVTFTEGKFMHIIGFLQDRTVLCHVKWNCRMRYKVVRFY